MKSIQFIKDRLIKLFAKFPFLTIRYKYISEDQTHVVEVLPFFEFENNTDYQAEEGEVTFEFDNAFFPESLLFVSENSLTKMIDPDFELKSDILTASFEINNEISIPINVGETKISCINVNYFIAA